MKVQIGHQSVTKNLKLGSSVADSVANAPLNSQKAPTGYNACPKCHETGFHAEGSVRMVGTSAALRTEQDWLNDGQVATSSGKPVHGIKPLKTGVFPMQVLDGWKVFSNPYTKSSMM